MKKRNLYLNNISIKKAINYILTYLKKEKNIIKTEYILVNEAEGRVTSEAIFSKLSNPSFLSSAMDGITTLYEYTKKAKETNPIILLSNQYEYIDTGDKIPNKYNCVIPAEEINYLKNDSIEIIKSYVSLNNIRCIGEDINKKELIISQNHELTEYDLGVILNGGIHKIKVWKKPKVVIIPTGDEIINPFCKYKNGKTIDCNSIVFENLLKKAGAEVIIFPIIKDNKLLLKKALKKALKKGDFIIIIAGSSAGRDDYTKSLIKEFGEIFCHGIALKPGKPTIIGGTNGKILLGLPGFPISSIFALEIFGLKIISYLSKKILKKRLKLKAILANKISSCFGTTEIIRVLAVNIYGTYKIIPLSQGSSSLFNLAKADGLLTIPSLSQGYEKGQKITIELLKDKNILKKRLFIQGSNDFTIDALKNSFAQIDYTYKIIEKNIGSLAGIISVMNKEAHCAGIHLFNSKTNQYNISYVKKYLGKNGKLIHIANRKQGFIVSKNNPFKIKNINDICNKKIKYINRQIGSGTRNLLDYLIELNKIDKNFILGYNDIAYTHLDVGAKIFNNQADVGIGILSAAILYNLDFIPITEESYDLCCLSEFFNTDLFKLLMKSLQSDIFKKNIKKYKGYNLLNCGKILI